MIKRQFTVSKSSERLVGIAGDGAPARVLPIRNTPDITIDDLRFCVPDNEKLEHTCDLTLLVTLARQMNIPGKCYVGVFRDVDGRLLHLVTDHTGRPLNGDPVPDNGRFVRVVSRRKLRELTMGAIQSFFLIRFILESGLGGGLVSVEGRALVRGGSHDQSAIDEVLGKLPRKIWKPGGIVLNDLLALPWLEHIGAPLQDSEVNCPLDGPVEPIFGELSSPRSHWMKLAGRYFVLALCPKCLGIFGNKLLAMN